MGQGYRERRYRLKFPWGIFPLGISVSIERPLTREGPIQWRPATRGAAGREGGYRAAPPVFVARDAPHCEVTRVMAKTAASLPGEGDAGAPDNEGYPKVIPGRGSIPHPCGVALIKFPLYMHMYTWFPGGPLRWRRNQF